MTDEATSNGTDATVCGCCGEERAAGQTVRLVCHDDVALCDGCIDWLGEQRSSRGGNRLRRAVPILATSDIGRAVDHYAALGFETEVWAGGGYGFATRDGVEIHLAQVDGHDPDSSIVSCYLYVDDAEALHAEWSSAGAGRHGPLTDTDYGLREGHHVDPDGNLVRYGSPLPDPGPGAEGGPSMRLSPDDPLAVAATDAIHSGDVTALDRLLEEHPGLAAARIGHHTESRTLLHVATDWPGHFRNVGAVITALARAGADLDAPFVGSHAETPLHWAASSDDVDAVDALIDAGADIQAQGAVLGGGSPLADAVGFGQWQAAQRLVERGATTRLKDAAALGLMDRVEAYFASDPPPPAEDVTGALWSACHGGQRRAAGYLLERGGDLNWVGWGGLTPLDVAVQDDWTDLAAWLRSKGAKPAGELG
ncbi:MAG: ankyrin repeat domain-containing protein [Acidimicrobiales bacterium]